MTVIPIGKRKPPPHRLWDCPVCSVYLADELPPELAGSRLPVPGIAADGWSSSGPVRTSADPCGRPPLTLTTSKETPDAQ